MASSDLIKAWLVDQYQAHGVVTSPRDWKRLSKEKDAQGRSLRMFTHPLVGSVSVVEIPGGFAFATAAGPAQPSVSEFHAPAFSPRSLVLARELLDEMRDPSLEDSSDFLDRLPNDPRYLEAFPALPSLFYFCFPTDTYENEYENETGKGVGRSVEELCIYVSAIGGDDDYMLTGLIQDRLEGLGLDADDEYHWSFHKDTHLTVREWTQRLVALGLVYRAEDCLFGSDLKALGATNPDAASTPPAPKPWEHAFAAALKSDDAEAVEKLIAGLPRQPVDSLANDGRGLTWVEAALDRQAMRVVATLLAHQAPIRSPDRYGVWAYRGTWERLERSEPGRFQQLLRLLTGNLTWEPGRDISHPSYYRPKTVLERDAWAEMAMSSKAHRLNGEWLFEAWEMLAERVGEAEASESFVRAWLHWSEEEIASVFTGRCVRAIENQPQQLDTWPSRTKPFPWQALLEMGKSGSHVQLGRAQELAQRLGLDLREVKNAEGETLLQSIQKRERDSKQRWQEEFRRRQRGGIFMVMQRADGTRFTQEDQCRERWAQDKAYLAQLEASEVPSPRAPRRRLSFD